jgi:hypothetical protein
MKRINLRFSMKWFEEQLNLPENAKLAGIREVDCEQIELKFVTNDLDDNKSYAVDKITDIGDFFRNPEKYEVKNNNARGIETEL